VEILKARRKVIRDKDLPVTDILVLGLSSERRSRSSRFRRFTSVRSCGQLLSSLKC
jgi:hypothetical protein